MSKSSNKRLTALKSWLLWSGSLSVYFLIGLTYGSWIYRRSKMHFEDIQADRSISHEINLPQPTPENKDAVFVRSYDPDAEHASSYVKSLKSFWYPISSSASSVTDEADDEEEQKKLPKTPFTRKRFLGYCLAVPGFILGLIPALIIGLLCGKEKKNLHGPNTLREFSWRSQRAFFYGLLKGTIYSILYGATIAAALVGLAGVSAALVPLLPGISIITGLLILGFGIYKGYQSYQTEKLSMDHVMSVAGTVLAEKPEVSEPAKASLKSQMSTRDKILDFFKRLLDMDFSDFQRIEMKETISSLATRTQIEQNFDQTNLVVQKLEGASTEVRDAMNELKSQLSELKDTITQSRITVTV